jgi:hypothetical protein
MFEGYLMGDIMGYSYSGSNCLELGYFGLDFGLDFELGFGL